jgi:hypothetical protein
MKRILALACLFAIAATALAGENYCNWTEKNIWMDQGGCWVPLGGGNPAARARCWMFARGFHDSCNKRDWQIPLKAEASVAQWIVIDMNGDGFHWGVRKPGDYTADCVTLTFRSNYDVKVSFEGFDNLISLYPDNCIDDTIEVMYAFSEQGSAPPPMGDPAWKTPAELNRGDFIVPDSRELHWNGWSKHIWCLIHVSPCNTSCEYVDPNWATINLTLQRIKPWIDPCTGNFNGIPPFPYQ